MKTIFALLLSMFACAAGAFDCLPKTSTTPNAAGTPLLTTRTTAGECGAWWCTGPPLPDGRTSWKTNKQCVLNKYRSAAPDPLAFVESILLASDAAAAMSAAASAATIAPVGAQDTYDFAYLNWANCQTMSKAVNLPPGATLTSTCPAMPTAPTSPPVALWRTPNATTLKLYTASGGTLTGQIAGRFAPANAACDSSGTPAKSGSSVYYPIAGASPTEFALCKQVQQ